MREDLQNIEDVVDGFEGSRHDERAAIPPVRVEAVVRQPKERWFVHHMDDAEDGWNGPHATIDAALKEGSDWWPDADVLYVAKGRKSTKAEREDTGCDYAWHVDLQNALSVYLPNPVGSVAPDPERTK
jgi:hypothetical protein